MTSSQHGNIPIWLHSVMLDVSFLEAFLQSYADPRPTSMLLQRYKSKFDRRSPAEVLHSFLATQDLCALRSTSKALKAWVENDTVTFQSMAFHTIYYNKRFNTGEKALVALGNIAPYCQHLVIRLQGDNFGRPTLRSDTSHSSSISGKLATDTDVQQHWTRLFQRLSSISCVTLSTQSSTAWSTFSDLEAQLIDIRLVLESANLPNLHTLRFDHIHPMGLVLFRWEGGAAFGDASWTAKRFWGDLRTLEIRLMNPFFSSDLNKMTERDFIKGIHGFLSSLSRSLHVLRFAWVGPPGPNPLLLDIIYGGKNFSGAKIVWEQLEELVLENVITEERHMVKMESRTAKLNRPMLGCDARKVCGWREEL